MLPFCHPWAHLHSSPRFLIRQNCCYPHDKSMIVSRFCGVRMCMVYCRIRPEKVLFCPSWKGYLYICTWCWISDWTLGCSSVCSRVTAVSARKFGHDKSGSRPTPNSRLVSLFSQANHLCRFASWVISIAIAVAQHMILISCKPFLNLFLLDCP